MRETGTSGAIRTARRCRRCFDSAIERHDHPQQPSLRPLHLRRVEFGSRALPLPWLGGLNDAGNRLDGLGGPPPPAAGQFGCHDHGLDV
jgi:hypothetical protein